MRAFTLIETIVYVGLLSILMGGSLLCAHQLMQASATSSARGTVGMEASFVLAKLQWMFMDAESATVGAHRVTTTSYDGTVRTMREGSSGIELCEDTCASLISSAVASSSLLAKPVVGIDGSVGAEVTFSINSKEFYVKKFIK